MEIFTISPEFFSVIWINLRYAIGHTYQYCNPRHPVNDPRLIDYLKQDLGLSESALALATRHQQPSVTELPIVLWNYGLINLEQLGYIFDWLDRAA
jgi:hypothetical protein